MIVGESAVVEVDGGVIVRVSDDLKIVSVPNDNKSVWVSNEELTVIDRQLWVQWTQQLPPIFQSAVDAIGLSSIAYSDLLAAQLLDQMNAMDTGIHNSLQIEHDAVAQQLLLIVNNHTALAGVVDTKITQADADTAISVAVDGVLATVTATEARIIQSYTVYVDANLSYDVKVYSTNGSIFKNGVIDTVLTAKVFKGKDDITSTLAAGLFTWTRLSADSLTDPLWNATKIGVGNVLHITTADVFSKAVFSCVVTLT